MDNNYSNNLLKLAQSGDLMAEEQFIVYVKENIMRKRIGKYLHKNRQVEDEDLIQEFMIGLALNIHKAKMDVGDPTEYLIQQGVYRLRSFLRKHIIQGTSQVCDVCGHETRLNRIEGKYVCRRCGSLKISTRELNDYDEILLGNIEDNSEFDTEVVSELLMKEFESTLQEGTNVYNLYILMRDGVNRDNPNIKNYTKEIARIWGGCSEQNVLQVVEKLKVKLTRFADDHGLQIKDNKFIVLK